MFRNKNLRKSKKFIREVISDPEVIKITLRCIKEGLNEYILALKKEIEGIPLECGLNWGEEKIQETTNLLYSLCISLIPYAYSQAFKDDSISKKYDSVYVEVEGKQLSLYKNYQDLCDKFQPPPTAIFSLVLASNNSSSFEQLIKSVKATEISARIISFLYDFVGAFCRHNPAVEGLIGDSIARAALQK